MFVNQFLNLESFLTLLLIGIAISGDYVVHFAKLQMFKAAADSLTHGFIGGITWLLICLIGKFHVNTMQILFEVGICTLIAIGIDLDHFYAAGSLNIRDATSLQHRPPLHSSTIPVCLILILITFSYLFQIKLFGKAALIIFAAFGSHHTRDATRRGYWFHPFGSTVPIPYLIYILLTALLPRLTCFIFRTNKLRVLQKIEIL